MMFVKFVITVMIVNFTTTSSETHVCTSKTKVSGPRGQIIYKIQKSCCLNYYKVNGTCKECSPGTFGSRGKCDKSCPEGRYGRFCSLACDCSENERCDPAIGCVCGIAGNCSTDANPNTTIAYSTVQVSDVSGKNHNFDNSTYSISTKNISHSPEEPSNDTGRLYHTNDTGILHYSNLRSKNITGPSCIEITIVLCSAIFSVTMLVVSTTSFLLIWYIGQDKNIMDTYEIC